MSLRELIILLLGLAIVGIILRGLYVALQARRGQLRLAIDKNIPQDIDLEALELAELPGGGARVVRRDAEVEESAAAVSLAAASERADAISLGAEDEAVPVLMDSVEVGQVAQVDTAASNASYDEAQYGEDDSEGYSDDYSEDYSEDYEERAFSDRAAESGSASDSSQNLQEPQFSSQAVNVDTLDSVQDMFAEDFASKTDPQIGDLQAHDEFQSARDEHAYDDPMEEAKEEAEAYRRAHSPAAESVEAWNEAPAHGSGSVAHHGETLAAGESGQEHPDDVLFDYDGAEDDETHFPEGSEVAYQQGDLEAYADYAEEDVEEDVEEAESVFISSHGDDQHSERTQTSAYAYGDYANEPIEEGFDVESGQRLTDDSLTQDAEVADETDWQAQAETGEVEAEEQQAPTQAPTDEFAEFSMTAGERIGGNPGTEQQVGLFDHFDESEPGAKSERGSRKDKKPSLFAALKRRFSTSESAPPTEEADSYFDEAEVATGVDEASSQTLSSSLYDDQGANYSGNADDGGEEHNWEEESREEDSREQQAQSDTGSESETDWYDDVDEDSLSAADSSEGAKSRQLDWAGSARPEPRRQAPLSQPTEVKQQAPAVQPSEVIVVNVVAREGREFRGDDLLELLITSGLKFGEMNIFHQRFRGTKNGPVIFSVANILNPGTFDLNAIHEFSTIGISLFLALPSPINNLEAFDQMLGVAQRLRDELDGELKDDHRNVMTAQTIEHYRQRIRDFELRQLKAAGGRA